MAPRPRFDRRTALERNYQAMKSFTYEGRDYVKGDPFPKEGRTVGQLSTLFDSRFIEFGSDVAPEPVVLLAQVGGSYYEIRAPWLDKPLRVRGKEAAEEEAKRVEADGPPLGFVDGGSDVTIEENAGGWYTVMAPWLDMPVKVQGRSAAEREQRKLHDAGEPASYKGVTVTPGENGWYEITADGSEPEKVQGEENARARAAELRATGGKQLDPVDEWSANVLVTVEGDKFVVRAPTLADPEEFDSADAAEARQKELREAGPPEGWVLPTEQPAG